MKERAEHFSKVGVGGRGRLIQTKISTELENNYN